MLYLKQLLVFVTKLSDKTRIWKWLSILPLTTMTNQIPPAHSTTVADTIGGSRPPPTYTAPTQFNIGSQLTPEPLVNISQIKAHLALLHAFAELKKEVEGLKEGTIPQIPADIERRWPWFVALAVERSVFICYAPDSFIFIFFPLS